MSTTIFLLLVLILISAFLLRKLQQQRALLADLQRDHAALAHAWTVDVPADAANALRQLTAARPLRIGIEILNPIELASTQSRFAGPVGSVAPELIRRIVYQRTVAILREELVAKGVQTEITIHGLA